MKSILATALSLVTLATVTLPEGKAATVQLDFTQPPRSQLWGMNFYRTAGTWEFSNVGIGIRSVGPGRYVYNDNGTTAPEPYSPENSQFLNETLSIEFRNNSFGNNTLGLFTRINTVSNLGIYAGIAFVSATEVKLSLRYDANVTAAVGTLPGHLFHESTITLDAPLDFTPYYRLSLEQGGGDEPHFTLSFTTLEGGVIATTGKVLLGDEAGAEVAERYRSAGAIGVDYVVGSYQGSTLGAFKAIPETDAVAYIFLGGAVAFGLCRRLSRRVASQ